MTTSKRVWALGLDGATLDLIRPWASEGHLPVLDRLMRRGVTGELRSTYPQLTGPAWRSLMTGKSPARVTSRRVTSASMFGSSSTPGSIIHTSSSCFSPFHSAQLHRLQ
jgi:predicted AlkP superfamily phosphohydrolase/phosphomutase